MKTRTAIFSAILAAALYALNAPLSKLLLSDVPPMMMASFLALAIMIAATVLVTRDGSEAEG